MLLSMCLEQETLTSMDDMMKRELENRCWPPTYIATVTYGKEEFAELEIGDALFPLDPEINICKASYGGVLLIKTSLTEEAAIKLLSLNPPSTLRRFMKILFCCEYSELTECLSNNINILSKINFSSLRVSERSGINYEQVMRLLNKVGYQLRKKETSLTLSVEPIRNFICFTKQLPVITHVR